jgi:hypothetical protein
VFGEVEGNGAPAALGADFVKGNGTIAGLGVLVSSSGDSSLPRTISCSCVNASSELASATWSSVVGATLPIDTGGFDSGVENGEAGTLGKPNGGGVEADVGVSEEVSGFSVGFHASVTGEASSAAIVGAVDELSISLRESRCASAIAATTKTVDRPITPSLTVHFLMTKTSLSCGQPNFLKGSVTQNPLVHNRYDIHSKEF